MQVGNQMMSSADGCRISKICIIIAAAADSKFQAGSRKSPQASLRVCGSVVEVVQYQDSRAT